MAIAKLTSKGQVTIPKVVRERLHLHTGDKMEFIVTQQGEALIRPVTKKVGDVLKVIIDREEGRYYIGRTEYDSPEVDNEVLFQSKSPLTIGSFVNVHITEAGEFDLYGFAI